MKPYVQLAETRTPDGTVFSLHEHDGHFYLRNDGHDLMSTSLTYSEQLLADVGCDFAVRPQRPRVLIGGLGLGFSLKRALELVGHPAMVEVAELLPDVIAWNREFLGDYNGPLLDDERTRIYEGDLYDCLQGAGKNAYDVILIDIDETPGSLVVPHNNRLYSAHALRMMHNALAPGGRLAWWLSEPAPRLLGFLNKANFQTSEFPAKIHASAKRARHRIYLGQKKGVGQ